MKVIIKKKEKNVHGCIYTVHLLTLFCNLMEQDSYGIIFATGYNGAMIMLINC